MFGMKIPSVLGLAWLVTAVLVLAADNPDTAPQRPLNIKPSPITEDKSIQYDYDIVYVRAPRVVKDKDGKERPAPVWPEIGHPYNLNAPTDLMLLHPDGSEEVLVEGGKGAVADPYVSFDAQWVYYAYFHDASANGPYGSGGADIYKVNVKMRKVVRLTEPVFTPNTGVGEWSSDYQKPEKGKINIAYSPVSMHPCPLPGGRIVFTSNRDGFRPSKGYPAIALQLFVMDDSDDGPGRNIEKIGHLNIAGALHPVATMRQRGRQRGHRQRGQVSKIKNELAFENVA